MFVLVLLYLGSCIFNFFSYGLFTFKSDSRVLLPTLLSVLPFFNSNWLPLLHAVLPEFYERRRGKGGDRQLIFTKTYYRTGDDVF